MTTGRENNNKKGVKPMKQSSTAKIFSDIQHFPSLLADDLSKKIFEQRILFSATGDFKHIAALLPLASSGVEAYVKAVTTKASVPDCQQIVIYGAGKIGQECYKALPLPKEKVLFCDRNFLELGEVCGILVEDPEIITKKYPKALYLNCGFHSAKAVKNYLLGKDISPEQIMLGVFDDLDLQYFDDFISLKEGEVFVDVGAFDGATSEKFFSLIKKQGKSGGKSFLFEPNSENQEKISTLLQGENYQLFPVGAWESEDVLRFTEEKGAGNGISQEGTLSISVNSLDNCLKNEKVDYIKMDIEGAELSALKGARETILREKPKLAISVYHKAEDIVDLFAYIHGLLPEFQFYLRHYSSSYTETVLYAIPRKGF